MFAFGSRLRMVSKAEDPLELANQEAELEDIEANLADRLSEIEQRKQKAHREWDAHLQELRFLASTNPIADQAIRRFSQTPIPRTEKIPERLRADSARRAALSLRKEAIKAEEAFLIQSDARLADIEEKLVSLKEVLINLHENIYETSNSSAKPYSSSIANQNPFSKNISSTGLLLQTEVQVFWQSGRFSGFVANLSEKEVFVATCNTTINCGVKVHMEFTLKQGKNIQAQGIVRWTRELDENNPNVFPGLGIELIDLTPETKEALQILSLLPMI